MGFADLPNFPQGGAARAENGNQGIPPEAFTQSLTDSGYDVLTSRKPEDIPEVRAVLDAEVDTLSRAMGHQSPPPQQSQAPALQPQHPGQPPQAPAPQWTDTAPQGADLSKRPLEERIHGIMQKYGGNFEKLAEAHVHADAARTRAQQQAAGYRDEIPALRAQVSRIEEMLMTRGTPGPPAYRQPGQPDPTTPTGGDTPITGDQFLANPEPVIERIVSRVTDTVVRNHLLAYSDAQRRVMDDQRVQDLRRQNQQEIDKLAPIMDEIYARDRDLYDALPQSRSFNMILERARDRQAAIDATNYHREITEAFGGNGTPAPGQAAPGTSGALPSGGTGAGRRPQAQGQGITDYSNTPAMNRLWRSRSDSREEMRAVTDILKERGFGEDLPIY
jgi:hypothetical protein